MSYPRQISCRIKSNIQTMSFGTLENALKFDDKGKNLEAFSQNHKGAEFNLKYKYLPKCFPASCYT